MSDQETVIWCIRAGKVSEADNIFLESGYVALGWPRVGNLKQLNADREDFKRKVGESYPDGKAGAIVNWASLLFRFVHEMKEGDIVVYPRKIDRQIYIGQVTGPYEYNTELAEKYPNLRRVEWIEHVPRTRFTQGALYEMGGALALFQIRNHPDEVLAVLGKRPRPDGPEPQLTPEAIEENTRDFIISQFARELKGHSFAQFVAHLLEVMGYRTRLSPEGPDGGVDIVAHKDELGFEPPVVKVQVKSSEGSIGEPVVSALAGKVTGPGEYGMVVALGSFTAQALNYARSQSKLRLIDGNELIDLVFRHYEKLDARYKGIIPLKRVYIPEAPEEGLEEGL